jgi:hypothetical protein
MARLLTNMPLCSIVRCATRRISQNSNTGEGGLFLDATRIGDYERWVVGCKTAHYRALRAVARPEISVKIGVRADAICR